MRIFWLALCGLCFLTSPCHASIELAVQGREPQLLQDVYLRDGHSFVALDEVVGAVGLQGDWDSVKHHYTIRTPFGPAQVSPGSQMLFFRGQSITLTAKPRFIDGRLRISDDFIQNQLPLLVGHAIYYRNLEPLPDTASTDEDDTLDRLFSFLLRKKGTSSGPTLRAIAVDVGHGGLDIGVTSGDVREKNVTLDVAKQLEKILKMRFGVPVYLSRDADYALTLEQRLAPARRDDVDLWLLLHAGASDSPSVHGVALFIRPDEDLETTGSARARTSSRVLARALATALQEDGIPVQGIYRSSRVGLGKGNLPTVLVECGYLSNTEDRALLTSDDGQKKLAASLYKGLRQFTETMKGNAR